MAGSPTMCGCVFAPGPKRIASFGVTLQREEPVHETGHRIPASLAHLLHHWAAVRRDHLPDIAGDPDWMDSCGHLGRLCLKPVEYRSEDPPRAWTALSEGFPERTTYMFIFLKMDCGMLRTRNMISAQIGGR